MSALPVLAIGDDFIPAASYRDAFAHRAGGDSVDLREVSLSGDKAMQHRLQQQMEIDGANSVAAPSEVLAAIDDAEALCLHFAPAGAELLRAAPRLRLLAVARAGLENVDVAAATELGIGVVPARGRNAGAVAELQLGLMLAEARNIARAHASIKDGQWRKDFPGPRVEIHGRTIGMVGFGHVGRVFSRRLKGFEPRLLAYDPYADDAALAECGVERVEALTDLLAASDFVVVSARLTPETECMIGADELAAMKPGAYLVNVSRSRLVDTDALVAALRAERIAGAGIDVYDTEPLEPDHPLRTLDNVTLTTHFGGDTEDTNRISAGIAADAVLEFVRDGRVTHAINAAELGWL